MSPYRRNVMVGVTVLTALGVLGWMIIQFGGDVLSPFRAERIPVTFTTDTAVGIGDGSAVLYRGVNVGQVMAVRRTPDGRGVIIEAQLDEEPPLPANVHGVIRSSSLVGGGSQLYLELDDSEPEGELEEGMMIPTRYVGLDLLPPEFSDLARELKATSAQFRESGLIPRMTQEVERIGKLVESMQGLVDDPQMRKDLRDSLANLRATTESAQRVTGNLEQFTGKLDQLTTDTTGAVSQARSTIEKTDAQIESIGRQMTDRLGQVAVLLEQFQSIAAKIDKGNGTAGQLVNDPRLYQNLVETTEKLNLTIADLRRLVNQWEQEGVYMKLNR